jgi:hypothetical protein
MIEKKIISEVNRISSLMGVNNNVLLNENKNPIAGVLEKLIPKIENNSTLRSKINTKFRINPAMSDVSTQRINAIKDFILTNLNLGDEGVKNIRNLIKELSEADKDFAGEFYKQMRGNFQTEIRKKGKKSVLEYVNSKYGTNIFNLLKDDKFLNISNDVIYNINKIINNILSRTKNSLDDKRKKIDDTLKELVNERKLSQPDSKKINKLESQLKKDLDWLHEYGNNTLDEILSSIATIASGSGGTAKQYREFSTILEKIRSEKGAWGALNSSRFSTNESKLFNYSIEHATVLERRLLSQLAQTKYISKLINFFRGMAGHGPLEIKREKDTLKWYNTQNASFWNWLVIGVGRGAPTKKVNLNSPGAYDLILTNKILKYNSPRYAAWRSFFYEFIFRQIKFQAIAAFLESLRHYIDLSRSSEFETDSCTMEIAKHIDSINESGNKVKNIEGYLNTIYNENTNKFINGTPQCLITSIKKEETDKIKSFLLYGFERSTQYSFLNRFAYLKPFARALERTSLFENLLRFSPGYRILEMLLPYNEALSDIFKTNDREKLNQLINDVKLEIDSVKNRVETETSNLDNNPDSNPPEYTPTVEVPDEVTNPPQSQQGSSTTQTTTQQQGGSTTTQTTINPEG